jgi:hypothetical protein
MIACSPAPADLADSLSACIGLLADTLVGTVRKSRRYIPEFNSLSSLVNLQVKLTGLPCTYVKLLGACAGVKQTSRFSCGVMQGADRRFFASTIGLDMTSPLHLDIAAGGLFAHKCPIEGKEILDHILRNSSFLTNLNEPHHESESIHEKHLAAESNPIPSTSQGSSVESSPEL